jgi:lincosamide nucleotidyltransferase A/C/D/E
MTAADVLEFLDWTAAAGVEVWIEGGWAVDAVLGEQTREHRDLDAVLSVQHAPTVLAALRRRGFAPLHQPHETRWNFEYVDPVGRVIDLHLLVLDESGTGGRLGDGPSAPVYPPGSLAGTGTIAGREIGCVTPESQVRFHTGYPPNGDDWQDVRRLCERFHLPVPAEYDAFRFPAEVLPAVRAERALLTPEIRGDPALAGALLHRPFLEFGSSGVVWRREPVLRALAQDPGGGVVEPLNLHCAVLGPGTLLITYRTVSAARATLRSSVWVQDSSGRWRLRFHQGTPTDASE